MSDTADYGVIGIGPASGLVSGNAFVGAYTTTVSTNNIDSGGLSGVYSGSLSAQGNMVAMQLSQGARKYEPTGRYFTVTGQDGSTSIEPEIAAVPYLSGYARTYMKDPTATLLGSDSAMPALTGAMHPSTGLTGNMLFYLDIQLTRLTGSNYINPYQFVNTVGQVLAWVTTSNSYLAALTNAEKTNLAYYRADSFSTLMTQGFAKYKQGKALSLAFRNLGILPETLNTGHFGTVNAVAKSLVDHGLGYINNFSDHLLQQGVVFSDIYNSRYTPIIQSELLKITNVSDLTTIQEVLGTTVRNFRNPTDYCYIDRASGVDNDSAFKTMEAVGKDLYNKAPGFSVTVGSVIADLLDAIQADVPDSVNDLTSSKTLLKQEIIDNLRKYMPTSTTNGPINLLNVIGAASGYLSDQLNAVNEGMEELYATSYGPQIRQLLENISRYHAGIPLNAAEEAAANSFVPNPSTLDLTYYRTKEQQNIDAYYALLGQLVSDQSGRIPYIVSKINDNYQFVCEQLAAEYTNFNKASISSQTTGDNNTNAILGFVNSLPSYAVDSQNLGTDLFLYGTAQPNAAGDLVKTILNQSKNTNILNTAGVLITGTI